jgi:5-methylcytosine-specific restriction endonuclease McrA
MIREVTLGRVWFGRLYTTSSNLTVNLTYGKQRSRWTGDDEDKSTSLSYEAENGRPRLHPEEHFLRWKEIQHDRPVLVGTVDRKEYWWHEDRVWTNDDLELSYEEVQFLIKARMLKKHQSISRARTVVETSRSGPERTRQSIPDDVKVLVWQRDRGRCVKCDTNERLEFDHIIPVVMGGANTARNLQLLCEACNRAKGGHLE